jgi:hypothetical protein
MFVKTNINNLLSAIDDNHLSWQAKGILFYVVTKRNNTMFSMRELQQTSSNGIMSIRTAVKELIKYGYIGQKEEK